jgi:hypothetical protein
MEGRRGLALRVSARLSPAGTPGADLRRFGVLLGAVFALIAVWPLVVRGEGWRGWAAWLAGGLIVVALAAPGVLGPLHRGWMQLAHVLSWCNTRLLLGVTYVLVMLPIGVARRILGDDPLDRRLRDRTSYWVSRDRPGDARRSMERRF